MFTKGRPYYCGLVKTSLKAFTLLECLVALLVISGSVLVYNGLTTSVSKNIRYLSDNSQSNWLLFAQQLRTELATCQFDRVDKNKLYVIKGNQALAFGQYKSGDFRKTNASGQGYQPMLFGLKSSAISQNGNIVRIDLSFQDGLERTFVYAFETKN